LEGKMRTILVTREGGREGRAEEGMAFVCWMAVYPWELFWVEEEERREVDVQKAWTRKKRGSKTRGDRKS